MSDQEMVIEILEHRAAPAPELPSHLFPGAGYDSGRFRVISSHRSPVDIKTALESRTIDPVGITHFDAAAGEGGFFVVDGEAPPVGEIIRWRLDAPRFLMLVSPRDVARRILAQYFLLHRTVLSDPQTFVEAGWTLELHTLFARTLADCVHNLAEIASGSWCGHLSQPHHVLVVALFQECEIMWNHAGSLQRPASLEGSVAWQEFWRLVAEPLERDPRSGISIIAKPRWPLRLLAAAAGWTMVGARPAPVADGGLHA